VTPIRNQYLSVKQSYPDAIVLFRLGDFYETFDDDAQLVSHDLEITLTSRSMGKNVKVPMAGVPAHSLDNYLGRLIQKGHKVAICEQLSDPATSKGLVDRDVVRVVTPGTVIEPNLLEQSRNNYLLALSEDRNSVGFAYVDITTGEFSVTELSSEKLVYELDRLSPAEIIVDQASASWLEECIPDNRYHLTSLTHPRGLEESYKKTLLDFYQVFSLESFGIETMPLGLQAAAVAIEYIKATYKIDIPDLDIPTLYSVNDYMTLDSQTLKNLEIFESANTEDKNLSLLGQVNRTETAMGSRLLRSWLGQPLLDVESISSRLDIVEFFFVNLLVRSTCQDLLKKMGDLERIMSRVVSGQVVPRELIVLRQTIESAQNIRSILIDQESDDIRRIAMDISELPDIVSLISTAINDDPNGNVGDGGIIKSGLSDELDRLKKDSTGARQYIADLEEKQRSETGIKSLKVGYNHVFGYYLEVSKSNVSAIPDTYIRRQTLANSERYIVPELKEYEALVLTAKDKINQLEQELYRRVCGQISEEVDRVRKLAKTLAKIDVVCSFAQIAAQNSYVRPVIDDDSNITITSGRHPVVENVLDVGQYVANDVHFDEGDSQIIVLTGPNMAGKSTFIRQVALITLMAQIGSFVPADYARIGIVDRIFTRVGLQDDLATGKSTFMVEMIETASILNQATKKSLLILDEIGRGTSTYDGLSIAKSVIEYIHNSPRLKCKTMFATHYHELTELAETLPNVRNFNVAVVEQGSDVVFLHKIIPGGADRSYGIHVAQLAGMPSAVVKRAWEILDHLEQTDIGFVSRNSVGTFDKGVSQLSLFNGLNEELVAELKEIDVTNLTPMDAITRLYELQQKATGSQ
jgi:DNA mismatch repair protein MutS